MKSTAIVLAGLFFAQLAAAGVLYYNSWSQRAVRPQGNLLTLLPDDITQLAIEGEGESVTLEKKDASWIIAASGLPAESSQVETALESFSDMKLGWAVASTDASHRQLEVADDKYQRRVIINMAEDTVGDFYIGTSPGFKRSHVRQRGADEVYSVAVNAFDLPPEPVNWLDKNLLQVSNISSVTIGDKELSKVDEQWVYDGRDNTDQETASDLVSALESIRVTDIAAVAKDTIDFQTVQIKTGEKGYDFGFASVDSDYFVTRQDIDSVFKVSRSSYDKVIGVELIAPETEPAGKAAAVVNPADAKPSVADPSAAETDTDTLESTGEKPVTNNQSVKEEK